MDELTIKTHFVFYRDFVKLNHVQYSVDIPNKESFRNAKNKQLEQIKDNVVHETYWIQLMLTLKFWIDDSSKSFEKTDIFIEKSINASFDLINISPLKSFVDFGKFLIKEKISMN